MWDKLQKKDKIKLIYAYVIWPLLAFFMSQKIVTEIYREIWHHTNKDIAFAAMSFAIVWSYLSLMLPPILIRFVIARRKLKYGLEMSLSLALSFFTPIALYYFKTGDMQTHWGIWDMLMVYCILSYKSSEYSEKWHSFSCNPILFMLIVMILVTPISGLITQQQQWYMPIWETIFACCVLTRHKNKIAPKEPEQPPEPPHREPYQHPEPQPPLHDTADTLIDIGLAHIGRITTHSNTYITPEQTQARHNAERPFTKLLAERYTDANTRKALARHFMLYKEVTLFVIFAMVLKNDKPLHSKIQSRLKVRLSLGLLSKAIASRNEYWRKLSDKFNESYTRTKDLAITLDYVFWSVMPETLKGNGFADLTGNSYLKQIFEYTREAVAREYKNIAR